MSYKRIKKISGPNEKKLLFRKPIVVSTIKNQTKLSERLKREAKKQGFGPVGISRIPGSERIQLRTASLERWLQMGHHADMQWMASPRRQQIESLLEGEIGRASCRERV